MLKISLGGFFMDPYRRGIFAAWPEWAATQRGYIEGSVRSGFQATRDWSNLWKTSLTRARSSGQMWEASRKSGAGSYVPSEIRFRIADFGILAFLSFETKDSPRTRDWLLVQLIPAGREDCARSP